MPEHAHETTGSRPRIEGEREAEVLDATLAVLAEVGYDRLTMDAVASAARAGKATLYRRWSSKQALVMDAICSQKSEHSLPDTGNVRDDLIALHCGLGGFGNAQGLSVLGAVLTAMATDQEFAAAWRRDYVGPKLAASRTVLERARDRGEISADADLDLLSPALAGIVLHRVFILGDKATPELVVRVIDQIILPALTHGSTRS
ncbi:TetR family transcriptional regulator [Nocardioides gansuensis]|uniref:TetR family transcriptional regulator n=1 Tax=Nocardioides gansuensis TaxID=2138300 RepID=A0A2T8F6Q0_9ACTN|nr:TetR/AcrR family transcriptional regulator [Nocardioides gansuensis]PVG81385.1 TetR family transcriptional regulator [Nocardioides gansuensis]